MSDDDDAADLLLAMGQYGTGSPGSQSRKAPLQSSSSINSVSNPALRSSYPAYARGNPVPIVEDPENYQVSGFQKPRYSLNRQPENLVTEPEREIIRGTFGAFSAFKVLQVRQLPSGRKSYLLADWQVIQRSSPKEEVANHGQITFHLRKPYVDAQTARMIVDGFESKPGSFVDFDKLPLRADSGSNLFQAVAFKQTAKKAFRQEETRRHSVVSGEITDWQDKLMSARLSKLQAGELPRDGSADLANKAKIDLVDQISTVLTSGKLSSQQMSQLYREFEPWGHAKPKTSEPDWNKLAVIAGLKAAPRHDPSSGPSSSKPGPYKPKPRVRAA